LNETTIAEALKPAGYRTAAIGKWYVFKRVVDGVRVLIQALSPYRHLGQRETYLPTNRGFDSYFGVPFSQDMGLTFWFFNNLDPVEPYQPTGLPLLNDTEIVEQPVALDRLVHRYVDAAVAFIADCAKKSEPFFLYLPFNHVHEPNSCSLQFCNSSLQGPVGDAVQEMDWAIGQILAALKTHKVDNNTLTFFTR
jgi:arylsulfatase A